MFFKTIWDSTINPLDHIWNEGSLIFSLSIIMFQMVTIVNHQLCFRNASSCNILFVDKPKVIVVIGGHSRIDT